MKLILIRIIDFYKEQISPFLGARCKYEPTCSEYMKQAIQKYGALKGIFLGLKRILRCHPFSKGGYDPLK